MAYQLPWQFCEGIIYFIVERNVFKIKMTKLFIYLVKAY